MEFWKDIPGHEGFYQASSEGRIRSMVRLTREATAAGERREKKVLKFGYNLQGRLSVVLCWRVISDDSPPKQFMERHQVHRLVYSAFHGPIPACAYVLHNDGKYLNNRPDNLRVGTQKENMDDQLIHGTRRFGEDVSNAKLTEKDVVRIRTSGESLTKIAKELGVSRVTVANAASRKTWGHVA